MTLQQLQKTIWSILEPPMLPSKASSIVGWSISAIICISTVTIILETVPSLYAAYGHIFFRFEVFCVSSFAIEYALRLWSSAAQQPRIARWRYALKPMLIIDFLAFAPALLWMLDINLAFLRLLRLVRVFKFTPYYHTSILLSAIWRQALENLTLALFALSLVTILTACLLYLLESPVQPEAFGSIPDAMWWALVSLTTVGYGDVVPITPLGKLAGAVVIILGVGFVAVPAGIFATSFMEFNRRHRVLQREINKLKLTGSRSAKAIARMERIKTYLTDTGRDPTSLAATDNGEDNETPTPKDVCPYCGKPLP